MAIFMQLFFQDIFHHFSQHLIRHVSLMSNKRVLGRIFSFLHEKTQAGGAKTQNSISEAACF